VTGVEPTQPQRRAQIALPAGARKTEVVLFAQLVSGLAPNWTFQGARVTPTS
jgi:hypothetical protein